MSYTARHARPVHQHRAPHSKSSSKRTVLIAGWVTLVIFWGITLATLAVPGQYQEGTPHANQPSASAPAPAFQPRPPGLHPHTVQPEKPAPQHYTVKSGDNLSAIAQRYHLSGWQPLYHANAHAVGANPNLIYPGQVLTVP